MVFSLPVWVPTNSGLRSANEFLRYPFTDSISFFRVVAHTILENDFYILDVLDVLEASPFIIMMSTGAP